MPRSRMVKPEFWDDEKLAKISRDARLTYIGMWNFSDDYGVIKGNLHWIKNKIYPYDEKLKIETFSKWLDELSAIKRIIVFQNNCETYFFMPKFLKHQKINRPSKELRNPEPPEDILTEGSLNTHGVLTPQTETETEVEIETEIEGEAETFYPEWLNMSLWKEFKKHRTRIKSPTTEHGEKLLIADLKKLIDAGENQDDVINATIKSGRWKGFWPVKKDEKPKLLTPQDIENEDLEKWKRGRTHINT